MFNVFNRKARRAAAKNPRTQEEIRAEYQQACSAVGDRTFQISILKAQVENLYSRMHQLGDEMNKAVEKAKKEEEKSSEEKGE